MNPVFEGIVKRMMALQAEIDSEKAKSKLGVEINEAYHQDNFYKHHKSKVEQKRLVIQYTKAQLKNVITMTFPKSNVIKELQEREL